MRTLFDSIGNVTYRAEYDFGATLPTRVTLTSYGNYVNGTCVSIGNNIRNRPCVITVQNGSGSNVSVTRFTYDSRGNNLSVSRLVGGSTFLTTSNTYNANGTVATSTDVNDAQTTFAYKGTGGCNNLLPTSIVPRQRKPESPEKNPHPLAKTARRVGRPLLSELDREEEANASQASLSPCLGGRPAL